MNCCQCQGIETVFDRKHAAQELKTYRRRGPNKSTRVLLAALKAEGVDGKTLLDIGGGVGAIQHDLAAAGVRQVVAVDASSAYLHLARAEAERRGYAGRAVYHHSNFVDLAPDIGPADIVTLDRVVCCYHDVDSLVGLSAARAGRLYGLVYPWDSWWVRLARPLLNAGFWLRRNPFRIFIHPGQTVEGLVRRQGLTPSFYRRVGLWQVVVYRRSATS